MAGSAPAQEAPTTTFHLTGYADASWARSPGGDDVATATLAPILHLAVGERVLLESELEGQADSHGGRETGIEYATASWFLGDHAALVAGKFLSPVGYFFQNQHPSWINPLPSAPPGFGHGGAAPLTEVGVQLRGGASFTRQSVNYAVYVGNGPRLGAEDMGEVGLDLEGSTHNPDGHRVAGGRLGWLPVPGVELGASFARGGVRLPRSDPGVPEPGRSYWVGGVDAFWRPAPTLDFRAEWLRQRVGPAPLSMAPDALAWRTWYLQSVWRFGHGRWEAVLREGSSRSPHAEATYRQTAIGLNWLLRPTNQIKLAWEFNRSADRNAASDRLLVQWAYAF